jgi:class 3 adenylate cyclase
LPLDGIDEEGTLAQIKALRRTLFDPKVTVHHGRIFKNTGDGALFEFASVVDAVRCAVEVQRGVAERNTDMPQEFRTIFHFVDQKISLILRRACEWPACQSDQLKRRRDFR